MYSVKESEKININSKEKSDEGLLTAITFFIGMKCTHIVAIYVYLKHVLLISR